AADLPARPPSLGARDPRGARPDRAVLRPRPDAGGGRAAVRARLGAARPLPAKRPQRPGSGADRRPPRVATVRERDGGRAPAGPRRRPRMATRRLGPHLALLRVVPLDGSVRSGTEPQGGPHPGAAPNP